MDSFYSLFHSVRAVWLMITEVYLSLAMTRNPWRMRTSARGGFITLPLFTFMLLVFFLLASTKLNAAERFVLGAEDQAGPWGSNDGTGCGNDIVKAAFAAVGDSAALEVLPYVRAKKMAIDGKLAGCFAMSWEPKLKDQIVFAAKPLYQVQFILLGRRGAKLKFQSLGDLPPKSSLGLVKDYEYPPEVRAVGKLGIRIEETATEIQNLKKLAAGRIDATVVACDALKSLALLLERAGVEGRVDSISVIGLLDSYVGFSVRNPTGLRAKTRFDQGMAIILADGTYASIVQTWMRQNSLLATEGQK